MVIFFGGSPNGLILDSKEPEIKNTLFSRITLFHVEFLRRSGYELNEPRQDFESQDQSEYRHGYNKIYTRHPQPVSR